MSGQSFTITIRSERDPLGREPAYRLKLLLKSLLRSLHFRCVEVAEVQPETQNKKRDL